MLQLEGLYSDFGPSNSRLQRFHCTHDFCQVKLTAKEGGSLQSSKVAMSRGVKPRVCDSEWHSSGAVSGMEAGRGSMACMRSH